MQARSAFLVRLAVVVVLPASTCFASSMLKFDNHELGFSPATPGILDSVDVAIGFTESGSPAAPYFMTDANSTPRPALEGSPVEPGPPAGYEMPADCAAGMDQAVWNENLNFSILRLDGRCGLCGAVKGAPHPAQMLDVREPSTALLFGLGCVIMGSLRRRP